MADLAQHADELKWLGLHVLVATRQPGPWGGPWGGRFHGDVFSDGFPLDGMW